MPCVPTSAKCPEDDFCRSSSIGFGGVKFVLRSQQLPVCLRTSVRVIEPARYACSDRSRVEQALGTHPQLRLIRFRLAEQRKSVFNILGGSQYCLTEDTPEPPR